MVQSIRRSVSGHWGRVRFIGRCGRVLREIGHRTHWIFDICPSIVNNKIEMDNYRFFIASNNAKWLWMICVSESATWVILPLTRAPLGRVSKKVIICWRYRTQRIKVIMELLNRLNWSCVELSQEFIKYYFLMQKMQINYTFLSIVHGQPALNAWWLLM